MKIILLGAPGSGKGSVAKIISQNYNIPAISTGDIIRDNIKNKTKLGLLSESLINSGKLVPDELVVDLVKDRLKESDTNNGYILDGFPRTVVQAQKLDDFQDIDYVFLLESDFETTKQRMMSRRVCPNCKTVYSINTYTSDICENCGTKIIKRADDNEQTIQERFDVYTTQTQPLVDFYKKQQKLYKINANLSIEGTYKELELIVEKEGK